MSQSVVRIEADEGQGSGVVVREDGMVLTAYHVVQGAAEITVEFSDGSKESAEVLGRDIGRDLAIVNIPRTGLAPVPFADPDSLQIGQTLVKLGYGVSLQGGVGVTRGIISAFLEPTRTDPALVQTDSAVNPGDSGAPLITEDGRIGAIATAKLVDVRVEGVSFGSLIEDGAVLMDRMIGREVVCQPQPTLTAAATNPETTYRNDDWGWFVQVPNRYEAIEHEGGTTFYRSGAGQWSLDVRSRWPSNVLVYNPFRKGAFASAEELIGAVLTYWVSEEVGYEVGLQRGVREVCRGSDLSWEQDFTITSSSEDFTERSRFMVIDGGSVWHLLWVTTWPEHRERYGQEYENWEKETDTILYTFRFHEEPLSP